MLIAIIVSILVWTEAREYFYGEADYSFSVDRGIAHDLQLNFDATIATPCHCKFALSQYFRVWLTSSELVDLTVDVRDAVGDRLHISDEFKKEGVSLDGSFDSLTGEEAN